MLKAKCVNPFHLYYNNPCIKAAKTCNVTTVGVSPAYCDSGARKCSAWLKITDVEVRQRVVDEAMHGAILTVHVLINQPWDEV